MLDRGTQGVRCKFKVFRHSTTRSREHSKETENLELASDPDPSELTSDPDPSPDPSPSDRCSSIPSAVQAPALSGNLGQERRWAMHVIKAIWTNGRIKLGNLHIFSRN